MAIPFNETINLSCSSSSSAQTVSGTDNETGNTEVLLSGSFPVNTNAAALNGAVWNTNAVQSIFLVSTGACALTGGNSTINLVPNSPFFWGRSQGYFPYPFNSNVNGATVTTTNSAAIITGKILTL
jgi:hypothetical protein